MMTVKNLSVGYDTPLLQDISFHANAGQILGILGRNGSGKTTLLRGLLGSIRRFSGTVWIGQECCTSLKPRELAARLSVLPQRTDIMDGILASDVMEMGRYPYGTLFHSVTADTRQRVQAVASQLGISDFLAADCGKLSQGQRQMVLFGRLLVQDTPVMLLDEPNAALDYDNTQTLFTVLRARVREEGKAALLVLHDPELALKWCDRILVLKEGAICADLSTRAGESALSQALCQLYPGIHVRKDPVDGCFRCYTNR